MHWSSSLWNRLPLQSAPAFFLGILTLTHLIVKLDAVMPSKFLMNKRILTMMMMMMMMMIFSHLSLTSNPAFFLGAFRFGRASKRLVLREALFKWSTTIEFSHLNQPIAVGSIISYLCASN